MIVPPTLTHASFIADRGQAKTEPSRAAVLSVLVVGAGIVAALAAATASGPFAGLRSPTHSTGATSHLVRTVILVTPIDASTVFPPPAPPATVQKVVTMYDVPAPAAAPATSSHESKGDAAEASKASASEHHPRSQPTPTPLPERQGGGGTPPTPAPGGTPPVDK
jgi:hypothetical protein